MPKRYRFSFTAASLQVPLMIELAMKIIEQEITPDQLMPEDIGKERSKTNKRGLTEMKIRLNTLLKEEIKLLAYGDADEQRYISLIAFARSYLFFRDFVIEVIAEKIVVFDFYLTDMDYNAFFNRKALDHPEADNLTDNTKAKIKQVCFKVLEQGGLINNIKERKIIVPILSQRLSSLLKDKIQDLQLLLN
ncbi:MAG TPA: hypothetical protein DEB12_12450 [Porphyromonadaceae bacterium]|jgi:hypothetical protein|nr:hypothetical protein [Porphyromonadaceae bacterium]